MADKKILIITYNYPPHNTPGVFRIIGFVNYFEDYGYTPYVLTVSNPKDLDYDEELSDFVYRPAPVWRTRRIDIVKYVVDGMRRIAKSFMKTSPAPEKGNVHPEAEKTVKSSIARTLRWCINFPDHAIWWAPSAIFEAWRLTKRHGIDYVLTSSPPHSIQLIGLCLKILRPGLTWIADYRDPWTDNVAKTKQSTWLETVEAWLERSALKKADLTVANTEGNRERLLNRFSFLKSGRVIVITNGYDPKDIDKVKETVIQPVAGRKTLTFVGSLYSGMVNSLVEACSALKAEDPMIVKRLQFLFVGYCEEDDKKLIARKGHEDLFSFVGIVSYKRSLELMAAADVLVYLLPGDKDVASWVPSKLYNYIAIGKPIAAFIPDGCAANMIRDLRAGVVIEPRATDAIKRYLKKLAENNVSLIRPAIEPALVEKYEKKNLVGRLAKGIEELRSID
jgi:glycosyltransferase involved in cell wall biosynthesis